MGNNVISGKNGEDIAGNFLETKGYSVLFRNYRYKKLEIDIIVRKENLLVFVEVKKRKNSKFGFPEAAVSDRKASLVMTAAENFIFENDWKGPIRFDIVAITGQEIVHFEDAFH
ncbi:YraN family protein [Sporocytophaga myxococcoides]|uniref:YraN family protein n=1 Tax=Sporocytophaga myxococcoides TaxID=153721 RepID=UPI000407FDC6|nr:YraN family protein [Sporocytophaga myxococcoides]